MFACKMSMLCMSYLMTSIIEESSTSPAGSLVDLVLKYLNTPEQIVHGLRVNTHDCHRLR